MVDREHLGIALALNVPVMVVITKIDICPPQILQQTITQVNKIMKSPGARKVPMFIKTREECINTAVSPKSIATDDAYVFRLNLLASESVQSFLSPT
jgi:GTPase